MDSGDNQQAQATSVTTGNNEPADSSPSAQADASPNSPADISGSADQDNQRLGTYEMSFASQSDANDADTSPTADNSN